MTLLALLILLASPPATAADADLTLGPLHVPLPGVELTLVASDTTHREGRDPRTGWTWRVEQVGDGGMQLYPEPATVRATVVRRDGLSEPTELMIVPMAGSLGSLFGARSASESVRTCFQGRAGSLWLVTMRSARSMIERSEPALRAACEGAQFEGLPEPDPGALVGLRLDPRVPVDWMASAAPPPRSRAASFQQSATGLSGLVIQQPREGHPYDTGDLSELQRAVARDGFLVRGTGVMRAAGQDAPRLQLSRPGPGGTETPWLLVVLRGKRSLWLVQSPVRSMGYPRLEQLFDLALKNAKLIEEP